MIDFDAARTTMVDSQVRPSDVTQYPIIDAMLSVPREAFVPRSLREIAYTGAHLPIGEGRVVLDPRTFGKMLDALTIQPDELVLDIGCGPGYSTAVIAKLCEAVITVEADEAMATDAAEALSALSFHNAVVSTGDLTAGDPAHGPYDVIVIEGAVEEVPAALLDQLKPGGRIAAIFLNGPAGQMRTGVKTEHGTVWRDEFDATAPLLEGFATERGFEF